MAKDYEYERRVADDGRWALYVKRPGEPKKRVTSVHREKSKGEAERISRHWEELRRDGDRIGRE